MRKNEKNSSPFHYLFVSQMEDDLKVVFSGYLEKRGKLNTAWKKRWCLAKDDQVFYYKSKDQRKDKPTGVIPLSQAVIRACYDDVDRENVFDIVTKERVYKLAAPSRTELNEWMKALEPSTTFQVENTIIMEAENSIKQSTRSRAIDAESKYVEEFELVQKKNLGQQQSQQSNNQGSPENKKEVEKGVTKAEEETKDQLEELQIDGNDDSDSGDGLELAMERQLLQEKLLQEKQSQKRSESLGAESTPSRKPRGNSFLGKPSPSKDSPVTGSVGSHRASNPPPVLSISSPKPEKKD